MIILFATIPYLYIIMVLLLIVIWNQIGPVHLKGSVGPHTGFSVIIPFRNEEMNLPRLISSLKKVNYPSDKWEVIFVNDHSEDSGEDFLKGVCASDPAWRIERLTEQAGKKSAITAGIQAATFEYIFTTDADCELPRDLFLYYNHVALCSDPVFISGPVRLESVSNSLCGVFQIMEQAALTSIGMISIYSGRPTMCNGANMCFRKDAFHQVGGYSGNIRIPTGDDQFLLKKMAEGYPARISFIKNAEAAVNTRAQDSWSGLLEQRSRWASKWKATGGWLAGAAIFTGITYLSLLLLLIFSLAEGGAGIFLVTLGLKTIADAVFVSRSGYASVTTGQLLWWPLIQLIYPIYVLMVIVKTMFGQYTWKGRRYSAAV